MIQALAQEVHFDELANLPVRETPADKRDRADTTRRTAFPTGDANLSLGDAADCLACRSEKTFGAGLGSFNMDQMKVNADGVVDLYFGPNAPAGLESNWIPTMGKEPYLSGSLLLRMLSRTSPSKCQT